MTELTELARNFNRNTPIWNTEFPLNSRDFIRVELAGNDRRTIINVRRWFKPLDGSPPHPTKKGLACDVRHLPDISASLNEALHQARAKGLLLDNGGTPMSIAPGDASWGGRTRKARSTSTASMQLRVRQ
jgi:hypothetical protein